MKRRGFLGGLIAAIAAPAIIRTPGLLMPVRSLRLRGGEYYVEISVVDHPDFCINFGVQGFSISPPAGFSPFLMPEPIMRLSFDAEAGNLTCEPAT